MSPCPGQALPARSCVDLLALFSSIALQRQSEILKKVYRAWLLPTLPAPHPTTHSRSGSLTPSHTESCSGSCGIPFSSPFRSKVLIFPSCQEGCLLMPTVESHSGNCPQLAHLWAHGPPWGQKIAHEEVQATQRDPCNRFSLKVRLLQVQSPSFRGCPVAIIQASVCMFGSCLSHLLQSKPHESRISGCSCLPSAFQHRALNLPQIWIAMNIHLINS